jgi:GntR family transcriptional regulator
MRAKPVTRENRLKSPAGERRLARSSVSEASDDPLYLQIARTLKKEIIGGVHAVGSQLPTEDTLRERFSVSRYTVREALRRLREDNLISSRQGAGTTVIPSRSPDSYVHDVMSINDLVSWSLGKTFAIEAMEMVVLDASLAAQTGLTRGDEWLVVRGMGHVEGIELPVCWAEYFIHRDFAAVGRLLPRHTGPIFPLIEDMFGQNIAEVHQDISATLISPTLAAGLKVDTGTAALEVRRSFRTSEGQVTQVTIGIYPASRYCHSMTMKRVRG